ncbi:3-hydroxy-5-phosphonooxypentane-2,4-dione thiolase [bioreactor metagenome]|uniref:3-hydroxy-5-phosphonooxypentane-2,4-dione thiolase n=1 Tax=bioreactor metagenome TaxID=1076179 RepID=A0A645CPD2_9ZZZZ
MNGKDLRIEKLFSKGKNAVIVAIDHGMFDGPIPGMINMKEMIDKIDPCIDGVLLSPGMLKQIRPVFNYKGAPVPIVRLNWSSVYCFHWNYNAAYTVLAQTVDEAVANGAEIVLSSLTLQTGSEENDTNNVALYSRLVNAADKLGIPVIGEYFPTHSETIPAEQMHEQVFTCCRILSELGCDMIKTFFTCDFKKVTESCPVPIFGLGANKKPTQLEALQLASDEIREGARGVVFGRNSIQVPNPLLFQQALCEVVKNGISAEEAVRKYSLSD